MTTSSYMIPAGDTNDNMAMRRRLALMLAQKNMQAPQIDHWTQGLAHLADSAYSGYEMGKLDREDRAERDQANKLMAALFTGGQGQAAPTEAPISPTSQPPSAPSNPWPTNAPMADYGRAIAGIESGGNYGAMGPVTKSGDRAYGKYQVMGANIPQWTEMALGRRMTPQEYLADRGAQEATFNHRFGQYVDKYGPEGAARAWFAGERGMNDPNRKDILGTSVADYGTKFSAALGYQPEGQGAISAALTQPQTAAPAGVNREALIQMLGNRRTAPMAQAIIQKHIAQQMEPIKPTDDIRDYEYARKQGFKGTLQDWIAAKRAGAGEYGLTPIWGTGPDGKPAFIQPGKSGKAIQGTIPEGFSIARDPIKMDAGTDWILLDPQTRQPVGRVPKNLAEAEKQKEVGGAQGKAAAALPSAVIDAEETTKKVDQLLNHEGLDSIVGALDQYRPTWLLGDSGRNALARLQQLQGGAFLQAFNMLKGGGAITEIEGQKAEQAIARMQRSQSEADFRQALSDFRDAVNTGVRKLRASAGESGKYPDAIANGQPAARGADALKKKYGLD